MPEDPRLADLEILKALQQASFNRWEKRRGYEWFLSYAIWGALAGFITIVVFGKDSNFRQPSSWASVALCLLPVLLVHAGYLFFIIEGTLRDLKIQHGAERAMFHLINREDKPNPSSVSLTSFLPKEFDEKLWDPDDKWSRRHGLLGQGVITTLLCIVAVWACMNRQNPQSAATPSIGPGGAYCQECTQNLSPPPAAAKSDIDTIPKGDKKTERKKK